jgi:hypothetical protein
MTYPNFVAGEVLRAQDMNAVGMWLVGSTTFTNTAVPFINGCFSSDYENYRIVLSLEGTAAANCFFRVRSGASTPESGLVYDRYGFNFIAGSISSLIAANNNNAFISDVGATGNNRSSGAIEMYGPNATRPTVATIYAWDGNTGNIQFPSYRIETNTAYTGIELFANTGNLTGSLRVYGYRN